MILFIWGEKYIKIRRVYMYRTPTIDMSYELPALLTPFYFTCPIEGEKVYKDKTRIYSRTPAIDMSYELPVLSYNPALLTPFYFTCPIEGEKVYKDKTRIYGRTPEVSMSLFANNYLDCLPDDITQLIMDKVKTPSIEELTSNVYDRVRERYKPVSFSLDEDQLYDELEVDCGDATLYHIDVIDSVNESYAKLEPYQIDNIYNDYFHNKKNAIDFLNNDNSGYMDDTLYDDSDADDYVKEQALKVKMFHGYIENYKLVFDEETFEYDEEINEWSAVTIIKHRMTKSS